MVTSIAFNKMTLLLLLKGLQQKRNLDGLWYELQNLPLYYRCAKSVDDFYLVDINFYKITEQLRGL